MNLPPRSELGGGGWGGGGRFWWTMLQLKMMVCLHRHVGRQGFNQHTILFPEMANMSYLAVVKNKSSEYRMGIGQPAGHGYSGLQ